MEWGEAIKMRVIEEGLHTSIQDLGRIGYRSSGFPISGPMDSFSMKLANYLVGNKENTAVVEMSFVGPTIEWTKDAIISITGADMVPRLNGKQIPLYRPIIIRSGDILQFRTARNGLYTYLAIKGGLAISKKLGSRSMLVRTEGTGLLSRKLKVGDQIPINSITTPNIKLNWSMHPNTFEIYSSTEVIHYIEGPQADWFKQNQLDITEWSISTRSNRMGYRLMGDEIETTRTQQLLTEPTSFGSIQVPPDGQPIILMADSQPTGGYPKIGQVILADLPKLSQLLPTKRFMFERCTISNAYKALATQKQLLTKLSHTLKQKWEG